MTFFDKIQASSTLKRIFQPGDVFEIRILNATTANSPKRVRTLSGFFDYQHIDNACQSIEDSVITAEGMYYTPNPGDDALLAKANNRLVEAQRGSSMTDANIVARHWLLIDCDSIRGRNVSGVCATDKERACAKNLAEKIKHGMKSLYSPDPIEIDSGNGMQLMYRIDLPADDPEKLCESILNRLANTVKVDGAHVDTSVYNAARIWRLPGSLNCKGESTESRPWRRATVLAIPDDIKPVPLELLRKLAGENTIQGSPEITIKNNVRPKTSFNLEDFIALHFPDAKGPENWNDATRWVLPVCPFNPEHNNGSAVIIQQANGAIGFKCHHNSCQGNDWKALRNMLDPNYQNTTFVPNSLIIPKVNLVEIAERIESDEEEVSKVLPWQKITAKDVWKALAGRVIKEIVDTLVLPANPPLPLEIALPKALALIGCALSGPDPIHWQQLWEIKKRNAEAKKQAFQAGENFTPEKTLRGIDMARVVINTAGGQGCNFYCLLIAPSSVGKDMGNLLNRVAESENWLIGNAGSAEGIAYALQDIPNGLISISEFENWLDPKHWQSNATSFLTDAYGRGSFKQQFSRRSNANGEFSLEYCYPNIIANVQPDIFRRIVTPDMVSKGLLPRFLIFRTDDLIYRRSVAFNRQTEEERIRAALRVFQAKSGTYTPPDDYGSKLATIFQDADKKLWSTWVRGVNEILPRLAIACAPKINDPRTLGSEIIVDPDAWECAEKILLWSFRQAEGSLMQIEDRDQIDLRRNKIAMRILRIIKDLDNQDGVKLSQISNKMGRLFVPEKERIEILTEMIETRWIDSNQKIIGKGSVFWIKNLPDGIL